LANDTIVCQNETIQLNAPTGYNYAWTPSQGLSNASIANPIAVINNNITYTLTITDAFGCSGSDSITINTNPLPLLDLGGNQAACTNGIVQLSAPAGYQYNWLPSAGLDNSTISNPIATVSNNVEYVLTITDGYGCTAVDSILITAYPLPQISFTADTAVCENACLVLTPIVVGNIQSVFWSPASTLNDNTIINPTACPTGNLTYSATVVDNNQCSASNSINVTINALPSAPTISFDGVTLSSTSAATYQWFEGTNLIVGATNSSYVPLVNGDYTVQVGNSLGCTAVSNPLTVNINALSSMASSTGLLISPNPVFDALHVTLNTNEPFAQVRVFNAAGDKVFEKTNVLNTTLIIDTKNFSAGTYLVAVQTKERVYQQRVVVIK
jgi:hypothetical protein